jgi:hypothetical protein
MGDSMSLILKTPSNGSVTLAEQDTASDVVVTVPAVNSTLDTLARAGNVLQVVQGTLATSFSTTSTSKVATGLAATITPSQTTSKILVIIQANANALQSSPVSNCYVDTGLYKNGSLLINEFAQVGSFAATDFRGVLTICYLDSPNTTSATAYQLYIGSFVASSVALNNGAGVSTITLMEIAA